MLTRRDALRALLLAGGGVVAGPLLSGCGSDTPVAAGPLVGAAAVAQSKRGRVAGAVEARPAAVRCVQAFSADLYRRLAVKPGNLVCSPYSVAVALAMTRNGARGRTAAEMDRVLHAPALPVLNGGLNALASHVESRAGRRSRGDGSPAEVALGVANSLWGQEDFPWQRAFLDALGRDYGAGLEVVDYVRATEEARRRINGWVAERTRERIPELIPTGVLDHMTRLTLVNALYLKAPWEQPFERGLTRQRPFTRADGTTVTASTMHADQLETGYSRGAGWQAVDLRYAGSELAMAVVLPDAGRLGAVERALDGAALGRLLTGMRRQVVDLTLPRWKVRTQAPLRQILEAMGMPTAFDPDRADFSGMTTTEAQLFVHAVLHEAFIAVDEDGTEAAAATAVVVRAVSGAVNVSTRRVVVDRPFLYVIHDVATATPLFVGRVDDPSIVATAS